MHLGAFSSERRHPGGWLDGILPSRPARLEAARWRLDVMSRYLEHFMCGEENPLPSGRGQGEGSIVTLP